MNSVSKLASILVVAAAAYLSGHSARDNQGKLAGNSFATVDMEAVINNFVEANGDFETLRNNKRSKLQALEAIKESIAGMQQEREIYSRSDKRFFELSRAIAVETKKLELESQFVEMTFESEQGNTVKLAYEKALRVIEDYAKQQNLDAVFLKTTPKFDGMNTFQEVSNSIVVRTVIYGAQGIDITEEIQKRMK